MSAVTPPPAGPSVALDLEPRLLRDALAVALRDRGFVIVEGSSLAGGCDVLVTSDDDDVLDVRAGAVVRLGADSDSTSIADLVALIGETRPGQVGG